METPRMSLQRFRDLLDEYGTDPNRWPQTSRSHAKELIDHSDEARDLLVEHELRAWGDASPSVQAPKGLVDRIMSAALNPKPDHDG